MGAWGAVQGSDAALKLSVAMGLTMAEARQMRMVDPSRREAQPNTLPTPETTDPVTEGIPMSVLNPPSPVIRVYAMHPDEIKRQTITTIALDIRQVIAAGPWRGGTAVATIADTAKIELAYGHFLEQWRLLANNWFMSTSDLHKNLNELERKQLNPKPARKRAARRKQPLKQPARQSRKEPK